MLHSSAPITEASTSSLRSSLQLIRDHYYEALAFEAPLSYRAMRYAAGGVRSPDSNLTWLFGKVRTTDEEANRRATRAAAARQLRAHFFLKPPWAQQTAVQREARTKARHRRRAENSVRSRKNNAKTLCKICSFTDSHVTVPQ